MIHALRCQSGDLVCPNPSSVVASLTFVNHFVADHPELWFSAPDFFTALMFSDGKVVATGSSSSTRLADPLPANNVPEPGSLALMAASLAALAEVGRRRSRAN